MKTSQIINTKTLAWIFVTMIIVGIIIYFVGFAMHISDPDSDEESAIAQSFSLTENKINEIELNVNFADVRIIKTDSDTITISGADSKATFELRKNTLYIDEPARNRKRWYQTTHFGEMDSLSTMLIEVPASFAGDLEIVNSAGKTTISDLELNSLNVENSVGDIRLYDVKAKNEIDCSVTIGQLRFENIFSPSLSFTTTLGEARGTIDGERDDFNTSVSTVLGDNNIRTNHDGKYTLRAESVLGGVYISFNDDVIDSASYSNEELAETTDITIVREDDIEVAVEEYVDKVLEDIGDIDYFVDGVLDEVIIGFDFNFDDDDDYTYKTIDNYSLKDNKLEHIDIALLDDVEIYGVDGDNLILTLPTNSRYETSYVVENETLKIEQTDTFNSGFNFNNEKATIKIGVPKFFIGDLKSKNTSSETEVFNMNFTEVEINTTSGDVELSLVTAEKDIKINSSSGDVELENVNGNDFEINTSSGDISLDAVNGNKFDIGASSGEVEFDVITGTTLKLTTSSGDIELENIVMSKEIEVDCSSATIEFESIRADSFDFELTSGNISGKLDGRQDDYSIKVDTTTGRSNIGNKQDGQYSLEVETTSGNIDIVFSE